MPHDKHGKLIQVGDTVRLVGKVTAVQTSEDYCDCSVQSLYEPPKQMGFTVTLCTQETEKIEVDNPEVTPPPAEQ